MAEVQILEIFDNKLSYLSLSTRMDSFKNTVPFQCLQFHKDSGYSMPQLMKLCQGQFKYYTFSCIEDPFHDNVWFQHSV